MQAWSAKSGCSDGEWLQIDAGEAETCLQGVVVQGRRSHAQHVTRIRVQTSADSQEWKDAPGGPVFETGCRANDEGHRRIAFAAQVYARFVRITPLAWEGHVSMRCGLLLGLSGRLLAGIPAVALQDGSVCAVARSPAAAGGGDVATSSDLDLLLDLESDPSSGELLPSRGAELLHGRYMSR